MKEDFNLYLKIIDGSDAWISVKASPLGENRFIIQEFSDFDETDLTVLPQFIPGDVVFGETKELESGPVIMAGELAISSSHPAKPLFEFLYSAITDTLPLNELSLLKYKAAMGKIKSEISRGVFIYPAVLSALKKLEEIKDP